MTNNDREAFEAWAKAGEHWDFYEFDGVYQNQYTNCAWQAWQAGAQHERDAQPGELCPACSGAVLEMVSGFGGLK